MPGYENILPFEDSVDRLVEVCAEELHARIETVRAENGDILTGAIEQEPEKAMQILTISSILAKDLPENRNHHEATTAGYRAFCFAGEVLGQLYPYGPHMDVAGYISEHGNNPTILDKIRADTQDYLQRRGAIDGLIGFYIHEIDPSGKNYDFAEIMAVFPFLLVERMLGREYIDRETDKFSAALDQGL